MESNEIDDLFREIIEPSDMGHSDKVWASLENHLGKKSSQRDKAIIFRLRIAVGALLFLFGSFVFYYFFNPRETSSGPLPLKVLSQSPVNTSKPAAQNYPGSKPVESIISSANPRPQANPTLKRNINRDQTQNPRRLINIKKPGLITSSKPNVYDKFTGANSESTANDAPDKISLSTGIKSNAIKAQIADSVITDPMGDAGTLPTVKDSGSMAIRNAEANLVSKSSVTLAALSKETLDSLRKNRLKSRLSVIAYFSPDFTMKYLKDNNKNDNESESDYNNNEAPDFSCNTGALIGYDLSANWSLKTGGTYAYLSQTIKPKTVYAKTGTDGLAHYQFNTTYGISELPRDQGSAPLVGDSLNINSNSVQSLQVIGIPLISKYKVTRGKFSYYAQLGASFNFLIGEKLYIETSNRPTTISKLEGLNEYYFGGIFGLGVSYNPTKKLSILLEPTVKGAVTPINNNTPITTRPVSFGLALGLGWHF